MIELTSKMAASASNLPLQRVYGNTVHNVVRTARKLALPPHAPTGPVDCDDDDESDDDGPGSLPGLCAMCSSLLPLPRPAASAAAASGVLADEALRMLCHGCRVSLLDTCVPLEKVPCASQDASERSPAAVSSARGLPRALSAVAYARHAPPVVNSNVMSIRSEDDTRTSGLTATPALPSVLPSFVLESLLAYVSSKAALPRSPPQNDATSGEPALPPPPPKKKQLTRADMQVQLREYLLECSDSETECQADSTSADPRSNARSSAQSPL
jgi:hypothetical protein